MNAGMTSERVYAGLKRRILDRQFRPGDRLEPAALADTLLSSVTPVRDALNRLTGEGLVEARTSEGFFLPKFDAPGLHDLYDWTGEILHLALRAWRSPRAADDVATSADIDAIGTVELTRIVFAAIAVRSSNVEHRLAIASANDRLNTVRYAESQVLSGLNDELLGLQVALRRLDAAKLRAAITAYHRRRRRFVDEIIRILYRNGSPR